MWYFSLVKPDVTLLHIDKANIPGLSRFRERGSKMCFGDSWLLALNNNDNIMTRIFLLSL